MLVADKKNSTIGNNALKTASIPVRKESNDFKRKQDDELKKILKYDQNLSRMKFLGKVVGSFVIGMVLISRNANINELQNQISHAKAEIRNVTFESEDYRLQLSKINDISTIELKAKEELNMIEPSRGKAILCNLNKDYFQKDNFVQEDEKTFWDTVMSWLF